MMKLDAAIKLSSKSLSRIAEEAGISEARLDSLVQGEKATMGELRRLAAILGCNISDLLVSADSENLSIRFRETIGLKDIKKPLDKKASAAAFINDYLCSIGSLLDERRMVNPFHELFTGKHESYDDALRASQLFRQLFFNGDPVSPLMQLPQILNALGVIVMPTPKTVTRTVDGASSIYRGQAIIFVSPRFPARMLFTLAHELGHIIANHSLDDYFLNIDEDGTMETTKPKRDAKERYADAFASCLLLPEPALGVALRQIRSHFSEKQDAIGDYEINLLARLFGVSFQVAASRCEQLALLPKGGAFSLYEKVCKDFGSPEKRAEQLDLPERLPIKFPTIAPVLLRSAVERVRDGTVSIGRAAQILNTSYGALLHHNAALS